MKIPLINLDGRVNLRRITKYVGPFFLNRIEFYPLRTDLELRGCVINGRVAFAELYALLEELDLNRKGGVVIIPYDVCLANETCVLERLVWDEGLCKKCSNRQLGIGYLKGLVEIISTKRLNQTSYRRRVPPHIFQKRVAKEIIHELGHLFGLGHCKNAGCFMNPVSAEKVTSAALVDVIDAEHGFCNSCKTKLVQNLEETRLSWIIWKRYRASCHKKAIYEKAKRLKKDSQKFLLKRIEWKIYRWVHRKSLQKIPYALQRRLSFN